MSQYSIAVVGNPNCGKSTLFNSLTGSNQRIGNWPGVTVEKKSGMLLGSENIEVIDLPGIYSLNIGSEDEMIARNHVLSDETDLVINIVDASNLERNLFLTLTLMEMGKSMILVLGMKDLAEKKGMLVDAEALARALSIPTILINTLNSVDTRDVRRLIKQCLIELKPMKSRVTYPESIETILSQWSSRSTSISRQTAIMLLEEDEETTARVISTGVISPQEIRTGIETVREKNGDFPDVVIAETKFACIISILKGVVGKTKGITAATDKIDRIVLNKWAGVPVFLMIMFLLFWTVTNIGGAFIDFFDILFGAVFVDGFSLVLSSIGSPQWLVTLLAGGVGAGIQTVATFIPIVFFMFLMLSILEDSGYLARAAFVMDRFMQRIGLPGKAFVPMLVGFGCTVPAVMATRTLENKKDKYLTIFMAPFMSCGARLPVYALFGAAFFGSRASLMIFSIYLTGFFLAILTGQILKRTLFRGEVSHFVMELPPYHIPQFKTIMSRTWDRLRVFIFRAGKVIVVAVLILSFFNSLGVDGSFGNEDSKNSVLGAVSTAATPVFEPMGIDRKNWPATIGLVTGLFAKEAIVGTITGLYGQMAAAEEVDFSLVTAVVNAFKSIVGGLGRLIALPADLLGMEEISRESAVFDQLRLSFDNDWTRAFAYLLFVLIYFPCVAAFGAIVREIGIGYGWLAITYLTILAWSVATLFFQIATGHNIFWIGFAVLLVGLFIPVFNLVSKRWNWSRK